MRLEYLKPKVNPKIARACAEVDANPDETSVDDELLVCEQQGENEDPARIEILSCAQMRAIYKPVHSMPWHVRGLSDHELAPLLKAASGMARDRTTGLIVNIRHLMAYCLLLVMLFISRSLEEAADVVLYGPGTTKPDAELAIYLASDPAEDRIRLEAIKPDYATAENSATNNIYHPAGYVWLPLPSLLGFVLRTSVTAPTQSLVLDPAQKLCTLTAALSQLVSDVLTDLDPSGHLNLSRLRSTLPARIWERTFGDLMLSSLLLGRKHHSLNSEFHYDGEQLQSLATLYREVTES